MATLFGPDSWTELARAARAHTGVAQVAVAYFGREAPRLLPLRPGSLLVVDASLETIRGGGTSPAALRQMLRRGVRVFSVQSLHAKLFIFGTSAYIGSANASNNSARYLVEAVARIEDPQFVAAARHFVEDLAVTELDDSALRELEQQYRPPEKPNFPRRQARFTTLIMELTKEQGVGRETQVQPPRPVWEHYFGVNFDGANLPRLRLARKGPHGPGQATGHISRHDHNLTVEIPEAEMPRPAILEVRKTGRNAYVYEVHRAGADFDRFRALLASRANPLWTSGRKWLII